VLIDVRIKPQKNDLDFMMEMALKSLPFVIVFTKADKISKTLLDKNIAAYKKRMLEEGETMPDYFASSAVKQTGRDKILDYIEELNNSAVAKKIKTRIY
jgi:GTP-binding protein